MAVKSRASSTKPVLPLLALAGVFSVLLSSMGGAQAAPLIFSDSPMRTVANVARMLNDLDLVERPALSRVSRTPGSEELMTFRVNVQENEAQYVVYADLPGVTKEDVQVVLRDQTLTISAERKEPVEGVETRKCINEILFGKVQRSFKLPSNLDPDSVEAKFENGLLTVVIKRIELKEKSIIIR